MQTLPLARLRKAGQFLSDHGFPSHDRRRVTTWAILAAHAAQPSTHLDAQANARKLLKADVPEKAGIHDLHPCVHLGENAARRWWVGGERLASLGSLQPGCLSHGTEYSACTPECAYGVLLDGVWIHDLLEDSHQQRPAPPVTAAQDSVEETQLRSPKRRGLQTFSSRWHAGWLESSARALAA